MRPSEVGKFQASVIEYVKKRPGCTSKEIKEALGHSEAGNMTKLAERGLLYREIGKDGYWHYYPCHPGVT